MPLSPTQSRAAPPGRLASTPQLRVQCNRTYLQPHTHSPNLEGEPWPTRIRWGLLSTAGINDALITPIRESERSELVAVASRSEASAQAYAKEKGIPKAITGYEALLADPDVDVIYIPLPNSMHAEWTVRAAEAGKHVLCEKPASVTLDGLNQMAEAAKEIASPSSKPSCTCTTRRRGLAKEMIESANWATIQTVIVLVPLLPAA